MPILRMAGTAVFVLTMVACTGGPTVDSSAPSPTPAETTSTTSSPTTTAPPTTGDSTTSEPGRVVFDSPQEYAIAAYEAWLAEDWATIERLATPDAAEAFRSAPAEDGWSFNRCEGAAGSMYCTWESISARLEMRVAIEAASTGQDHAVTEVKFVSD